LLNNLIHDSRKRETRKIDYIQGEETNLESAG